VVLIPTVSVIRKSDGARCIIGKADFNEAEYTLANAKAAEKKPEAVDAPGEYGLADMTVGGARETVDEVETVEELDALLAEETAGKVRKGVLDAIEAKRAELAEE